MFKRVFSKVLSAWVGPQLVTLVAENKQQKLLSIEFKDGFMKLLAIERVSS